MRKETKYDKIAEIANQDFIDPDTKLERILDVINE